MQDDLLNQGLTLLLAGMGTVFVFLTTLVIAMSVMSRIVMRFQHVETRAEVTDDEVAAISAAITAHRRKQT